MQARGWHTARRLAGTDALPVARGRHPTGPASHQLLSTGPPRPSRTTDRRRSPAAGCRERSSPTTGLPPCPRRSRSLRQALAPFRPRGRPGPHPSGPLCVQARTGEPSLPARGASMRGHRLGRPKPGRARTTPPPKGRRPTTRPVRSDIHSPPQDDTAPGPISSLSPRFSASLRQFAKRFLFPGHR